MMRKKGFIHEDFLLQSNTAVKLYHDYAKDLPIIDFHNHLPPREISDDINFRNLTHIWLEEDHYKWRALRTCGVSEEYITGEASEKEKFLKWAETVPKTLRNPLYHWTHMELSNIFGFSDVLLNPNSAELIWEKCNSLLQTPEFSARALLEKHKVKVVGTTDDPTESLEYHYKLKNENLGFRVVPSFRPDVGMEIENGPAFRLWVKELEKVSGISINTFQDFLDALKNRHDYFDDLGCRASDHGIERPYAEGFSEKKVSDIFSHVMQDGYVNESDASIFKSAFLYYCGLMNYEKRWVMQFHIGPLRNNNTRMMNMLGKNAGFDSIGDISVGKSLAKMLNRLDLENKLPKTILYNVNPKDNELFSSMAGNFPDESIPGKVQHGPSWWFLDQKNGIEEHIESISNVGILYNFVGMTTDSRSFLSYQRHDYFRRILCNILGGEIEQGLLPDDSELIASYIEMICYLNAKDFFGFQV